MPHLLGMLLVCLLSSVAYAEEWVISHEGYGPVKVGMTVKQASQALGAKLIPEGEGVNPDCYHVHAQQDHTGLSIMVIRHRVARVSIYGGPSPIKTDKGIGIGDSEAQVRDAYGQYIKAEPHKYGSYPNDKYLTYWTADKKSGVRYETYESIVNTIHGGSESIRYVEGCS